MRRFFQLLQDNPKRAEMRVARDEEAREATIYLYDVIGPWAIEAADMARALAGIDADVIHLRINSPGGDVFDARAIKTSLEEHPAKIIAHIDGVSASAATMVMLAADEIRAAPGSFVMIHNPWTVAIGDKDEMMDAAQFLEQVGETIVADYRKKTGIDEGELRAMMEAETWMEADDAKDKGFVDQVTETGKAENRAFNLGVFDKAPKALTEPELAPEIDDYAAAKARLQAKLKLYEKAA